MALDTVYLGTLTLKYLISKDQVTNISDQKHQSKQFSYAASCLTQRGQKTHKNYKQTPLSQGGLQPHQVGQRHWWWLAVLVSVKTQLYQIHLCRDTRSGHTIQWLVTSSVLEHKHVVSSKEQAVVPAAWRLYTEVGESQFRALRHCCRSNNPPTHNLIVHMATDPPLHNLKKKTLIHTARNIRK